MYGSGVSWVVSACPAVLDAVAVFPTEGVVIEGRPDRFVPVLGACRWWVPMFFPGEIPGVSWVFGEGVQ